MPQIVEIPEVGPVEFPDGMDDKAISTAASRLYGEAAQARVSPNPVVNQRIDPAKRIDLNEGLRLQQQAAARSGDRWETVAKVADIAGMVTRPFASTPENPLGSFGTIAGQAGAVVNEAGNTAERLYTGVAESYGLPTGSIDREVARAVPGIAAAMTGAGTLTRLGVAPAVAEPLAFGAVPFAQTLDATGDTAAAVRAGAVGTMIPGVASMGREAVAAGLGKLVNSGVLAAGANTGQKVAEALGAQGAISVFMEGMNVPEYLAMAPEEREAALLHNLGVNTAFLMLDVPGVVSRSASRTRQQMKPAAKVGELMETLVNDPQFTARMTQLADQFAVEQMNVRNNPRNAQLQVVPPEIANVEAQFIDPSLPRPEMGNEQRVVEDYVEPAPTETVVRADEFQVNKVQVPSAEPNADAVVVGTLPTQADVDLAAGRTPAITGKAEPIPPRPTEPIVQQKPAKGTKRAKKPATLNVAPEPPAAAVEKVQEHVAEVAAGEKQATPEPALQHTTGPRAAKEIKSELVQRIEAELEKLPEFQEVKFSKPATYNGKKKFSAMIDGHSVEVREGWSGKWEIVDFVVKKDKKSPTGEKRTEVVLDSIGGADMGAAKRLAVKALEEKAFPDRAKRTVTIEIPGDGTFTVNATRYALDRMLTRAKALETSTEPKKAYTESLPTKQQGEMWAAEASTKPEVGYYVRVGKEYQKVPGKAVKLKGLPDYEFFLHKPVEKDAGGWRVSEAKTGLRLGEGTTEKEAVAKAEAAIERIGVIVAKGTIEENYKAGMVSPRGQPPAESINTGALGEAGMGGAKPTEFTAGSATPTSIKNATVDAERAARGLPAAMEPARRTWGEVWDRAMAVIDQNPAATTELIAQLKAKPRALSDIEDALLLHRQIELQNQYGRQTRELAAAYDDSRAFPNRLEAVERFKVLVQETSNQLLELYDAGKAAGTETGRGLAARKMLADEQFELAQMETELRSAKEGTPLTDAERAKLTEAHNTIQRLQAELDAAAARAEEARAERRAAEATEDLKQAAKADPDYNPAVIKLAERIVETLERRGKAAEDRLKAKFARTSAGIDPTILADVIEIGAGRIARKALPFAEWADGMLKDFGDAVKDYLEPAWAKLGERMDKVATDIAGRKKGEAFKKMRVLDEGQRRQKLIDSITEAAGEDRPLDEIGTYVRRLALQFVKDGISDRTKLVDAVHSVLVNHFDPEITRREAMDAISGYGDFKPLDPDPAKRTLRDLKGQLQSVAKLEDIEALRPLLKTGVERRAPSDEERRLIQQVNEAKRVHGVVTTDPARQLKSAQDGILTRLKHQIADLNFQIDAGERTVKSAAKVASTPEIDALRIERDALKKRLDEMLPRPGITEAQRLAMAERALEADLALYEAKIAARDTGPLRAKSAKLHSEKLEQLRARRDVLKAELAELRAAANPKLTPEERALRTLKRRLATEYAKTMDRIARADYTPRRRVKEPFMDAEAAKLKGELDKAKAEWRRGLVAERMKNRSLPAKVWDAAKEVTHAQRQFWTSMDFSAVLRQGGILTAAHPIRGASSTGAMFRALSEAQANAEWAKVQARPNWSRYQRAKLYLADPHETTITKLEEQVRSRWLAKVPGIKQSNQTYTTFLNKLRADSFDAMVGSLEGRGVTLNDAELAGVANYINIATGRGDFGKLAGAADTLAMAFFSPRLLLSRFQYLLGQPLAKAGSWRVRRQIAAEYARTLAAFGVVLALGAIAGAEIEEDPVSSDYLKLKFGNTRVDFGAGLLQPLVYLARTVAGETKTAGGELRPIRGTVPYGAQNWWDVTGNFARSKFSPSMSTTVDLLTGKNVVGEDVTVGGALAAYAVPLSFREVGEIMRQHGVPEGTTMTLLGLFGAGVNTRRDDAQARKVVGELMRKIEGGTPEQREAVRKRLLEALTK